MTNVKVLRTNRQMDRWTGKKVYAPDLSMQGHKKNVVKRENADQIAFCKQCRYM